MNNSDGLHSELNSLSLTESRQYKKLESQRDRELFLALKNGARQEELNYYKNLSKKEQEAFLKLPRENRLQVFRNKEKIVKVVRQHKEKTQELELER
jgi:hypothetical protein